MVRPIDGKRTHVVLVGGGHTHALVLKDWNASAHPDIRLTLINPDTTAPYTGMLPGFVAGHYARGQLDIDLAGLCRRAGAQLILNRAVGLEASKKRLHLASGNPLCFDLASINIGISSAPPEVDFGPMAVPVKPLGPFAGRWADFVARDDGRSAVGVIGAGLGGVELALAMAYRLGDGSRIVLLERGDEILSQETGMLRRIMRRALRRAGVRIRTGVQIMSGDATGLELSAGERLPLALVAVAAGAHAANWVTEGDIKTESGFITVGPTLQSVSHPDVFAAGDIAHLAHAPRPKAGVFAVREAPVLARNLAAHAEGRTLSDFDPQSDYLRLVTLGARKAVASKWGLSMKAPGLWALKDRIDRAFMDGLASGDVPTD